MKTLFFTYQVDVSLIKSNKTNFYRQWYKDEYFDPIFARKLYKSTDKKQIPVCLTWKLGQGNHIHRMFSIFIMTFTLLPSWCWHFSYFRWWLTAFVVNVFHCLLTLNPSSFSVYWIHELNLWELIIKFKTFHSHWTTQLWHQNGLYWHYIGKLLEDSSHERTGFKSKIKTL